MLLAVAAATPLAKQRGWRPLKTNTKRSPDGGFGFGGNRGHRHFGSHGASAPTRHFSSHGAAAAPSGYGAPAAGPVAPRSVYHISYILYYILIYLLLYHETHSAPSGDYGVASAPACRTEYEQECTTVNEEQCETVQDQVRWIMT